MRWRKHGVVWQPDGSAWWARSHATCPTPLRLNEDTVRVYVQCRDQHGVGRVGYVDLDAADPRRVVGSSAEPVFDIGQPGTFDDNGVFQASIIRAGDGRILMYYVGFELCHHIRYRLLTGLAISEDGGESFYRARTTPILERSPQELHFRCGPWVMAEDGRFRMWYVAGSSWEVIDGKSMPIYDLRYMESGDGLQWQAEGLVVMPVEMQYEHGFGRPVVLKRGNQYRMHYSIRRREPLRYAMGFAVSDDGRRWVRRDHELGIDVSASGWDSESVEYGVEIELAGRTWLLYNGNDFGATGFGIAELVEP